MAIMLTMTTHGTSLPDEERRCVEHDVLLPAEPIGDPVAPQGVGQAPLLFARSQLHFVGKLIGTALQEELGLHVWALAVQVWYAHLVVAATWEPMERIVRCADDAVREGLELKRPVWGDGCDRRFCFEEETARQWIAYVERHNAAIGLAPRPWPFIETPDF